MKSAKTLKLLATILIVAGVIAFVGIFALTLLNGGWPMFLRPVQRAFQDISSAVGEAAFFVEGLLFVGPGLLLLGLSEWVEERQRSRR